MKKVITFILCLAIAFSAVVPASAASFTALAQLQQYIEDHTPAQLLADTHFVELEGVVVEIHWCGANNHYEMTLQANDPQALRPIGAEAPLLVVHFRLHLAEPPFQVGETVAVFGTLNPLYSSVVIPCVLAKTINGTEDF